MPNDKPNSAVELLIRGYACPMQACAHTTNPLKRQAIQEAIEATVRAIDAV